MKKENVWIFTAIGTLLLGAALLAAVIIRTSNNLEEPPILTVVSDESACEALLGTYAWQHQNSDGTATTAMADSPHPLNCRASLPPLEIPEETALLRFRENPDRIVSIRCWSDLHWSDPTADNETADFDGYEIHLKPGGYIYEVEAEWNTDSGYGGTACYSFYVNSTGANGVRESDKSD